MEWKSVDTQSDLDKLDNSVCWEDSKVLEYYAKFSNESYFPSDVSRSGWVNKNIHILIEAVAGTAPYLEIVLIDCDHFSSLFLERILFQGRVDSLKRIEIIDYKDNLVMRCSRLIYRFLTEEDIPQGLYFRQVDSIT